MGDDNSLIFALFMCAVSLIGMVAIYANWIRTSAKKKESKNDPMREELMDFIHCRTNDDTGKDMDLSLWHTKLGFRSVLRLNANVLTVDTRDGEYLIEIRKKEE